MRLLSEILFIGLLLYVAVKLRKQLANILLVVAFCTITGFGVQYAAARMYSHAGLCAIGLVAVLVGLAALPALGNWLQARKYKRMFRYPPSQLQNKISNHE